MRARVLTVRGHGRSYRVLDQEAPGTGLAPGKVVAAAQRHQPYEAPLLEYITTLGLTGVAVDVGANVGGHSLWLATMCGLRVEAFEPLAYTQLRANVDLNHLGDRIRVHPVALGARAGVATLVGDGGAGGQLAMAEVGSIRVHQLDSYELSDVALIKVDAEGMEALVLAGAGVTIARNRPLIFAEQWTAAKGDEVGEVLRPLGYQRVRVFTGRQAATPMAQWAPLPDLPAAT